MNVLMTRNAKNEAVLILVLEPGNINLLVEKKPLHTRIEDYFPEGIPRKLELLLYFSPTPHADAKEFAKMASVTLDERSAANAGRRPHCPECRSTIEQLGVWKNESPVVLLFCPQCGCTLGSLPKDVLGDAREAAPEPCFTCEGEQGLPATHTVKICAACAGDVDMADRVASAIAGAREKDRETDTHLPGRIAARLDEYKFIAQMVAGVEEEDWYKRRIAHLKEMKAKAERAKAQTPEMPANTSAEILEGLDSIIESGNREAELAEWEWEAIQGAATLIREMRKRSETTPPETYKGH